MAIAKARVSHRISQKESDDNCIHGRVYLQEKNPEFREPKSFYNRQ